MRIIAGKYKGRKILVPKTKLRPTMDFTREALFNIIDVQDCSILDLFSGSGSFGLECLSRNCKEVTFVEKDRNAIETIKKNLSLINENAIIIQDDVIRYLKKNNNINNYDYIFLDPPYNTDLGLNTLILLDINHQSNDNLIIIYEHSSNEASSVLGYKFNYIQCRQTRKYGSSTLTFFDRRKD